MEAEKLSRLKIESDNQTGNRGRKFRRSLFAIIGLAILSAIGFLVFRSGFLASAVPIQITNVTWVYPSQTITDFNASGYVR